MFSTMKAAQPPSSIAFVPIASKTKADDPSAVPIYWLNSGKERIGDSSIWKQYMHPSIATSKIYYYHKLV